MYVYAKMHEALILAQYALTGYEQSIFFKSLAFIKDGHRDLLTIRYSFTTAEDLVGNTKGCLTRLKGRYKTLMNKRAIIEGKACRWLDFYEIDEDAQTFTVKLSDDLKPYLIGLPFNSPTINVSIALNLHPHTCRIYMLAMLFLLRKTPDTENILTISEILNLMRLEGEHKKPRKLNNFLLKPAQRQLNKLSDIEISIKMKPRKPGQCEMEKQVIFNVRKK